LAERIVEAARDEVRLVYRTAAVPRSTIEALYVKKTLKTIKERALSDFKIELLYLSQYYAKRMSRQRDEEVGLCKPQRPGGGRSPQTNSEGGGRCKEVERGSGEGTRPRDLRRLSMWLSTHKTLDPPTRLLVLSSSPVGSRQ